MDNLPLCQFICKNVKNKEPKIVNGGCRGMTPHDFGLQGCDFLLKNIEATHQKPDGDTD